MSSNPAQKHLLHLELAKLLEAGFGIRQAIATILRTNPPGGQAALLTGVEASIAAGKSISDAFSASTGVTDLERSIIGAGERGGRMAQSFRHLADYFEMLARTRRQAAKAMIQPLVLIHMGVFLAVVPFGLIAGKGWGEILVSGAVALGLLYGGLFVAWVLVRMALAAAPGNAAVDSLINRIPTVGAARRAMAMARFARVYHTGLLAGLSMSETVSISLDATQSGVLREAGRELLITAETGGPLGPVFARHDAFPSAFARSYETAEEAGGLDHDLARWAKYYQEDAVHRVEVAAATIPRVLYTLILIFVAWKIISFFLSYYNMLDHIEDYGSDPSAE
ncbi:type II secretion system F family protein [Luteolibacter sp. SL250]|uniref:type II secretion system F family protein n=1 Tax=Luteolibacter sp. SL250 TaxID=2995170 RepID=UPI00226FA13A|nr:type II secretion system F family protein [Luteolibacter sp. SL250]WAC19270.1 type II secretion system F family protein [Luteolibacter sp. SL250]